MFIVRKMIAWKMEVAAMIFIVPTRGAVTGERIMMKIKEKI